MNLRQTATLCQAFADGLRRRQFWLLLHVHHAQTVLASEFTVVQLREPGDDLQQCRLAGAVATDQPDALAVLDREIGAVEQGMQPVGEFGRASCRERVCNDV